MLIQISNTSTKVKGSFRISHYFSLFVLQDDPFKIKSGGMVDMKKLKERGKDRWVHVGSEDQTTNNPKLQTVNIVASI